MNPVKLVTFEIEFWERPTFEALSEQHDVAFEENRLDPDTAEQHADANLVEEDAPELRRAAPP